MARSLSLSAYLALRGASRPEIRRAATEWPGRPKGGVVWVRLGEAERIPAARAIIDTFVSDGDQAFFVITAPSVEGIVENETLDFILLEEPGGQKSEIRRFLRHWQPDLLVWLGGALDPYLLVETDDRIERRILVDANARDLSALTGRWWFSRIAANTLDRFDRILAQDDENYARLASLVEPPKTRVVSVGRLDDGAVFLPFDETERAEYSAVIGTRQVWFAASATLAEANALAVAHRQACRRAHRLLLIVEARNPGETQEMAERFRGKGLQTEILSDGARPSENVQVFIVDNPENTGLWYQLSPIAYMGNSLTGGGCPDPMAAAASGSAIIHGPFVIPHSEKFARLDSANGGWLARTSEELGNAVERLIAPDRAAQYAHAAWDVITRGAEATNRTAESIRQMLEEAGY